jgi:hypothetical protein
LRFQSPFGYSLTHSRLSTLLNSWIKLLPLSGPRGRNRFWWKLKRDSNLSLPSEGSESCERKGCVRSCRSGKWSENSPWKGEWNLNERRQSLSKHEARISPPICFRCFGCQVGKPLGEKCWDRRCDREHNVQERGGYRLLWIQIVVIVYDQHWLVV